MNLRIDNIIRMYRSLEMGKDWTLLCFFSGICKRGVDGILAV